MIECPLFLQGQWQDRQETFPVLDKFSLKQMGVVSLASTEDIELAVQSAQRGFQAMRELHSYQRSDILKSCATHLREESSELARLIAIEAGKALKFAKAEVDRAVSTFEWASEEAKRIHGETLPLDTHPSGTSQFGYYLKEPIGIVAAITPFNFPLNLVAHKVAPALAAGNSVILKPASTTPLSSLRLVQILLESGCPPEAIQLLTGPGAEIGKACAQHPLVRKVSFTGSAEVGQSLIKCSGIKKVTLELGNNSPVVLDEDINLDACIPKLCTGAFYNSGQVCISVQRVYIHHKIYETFKDQLIEATQKLIVGNPLNRDTDVGPMIDPSECLRLKDWIDEAQQMGAILCCGGHHEGTLFHPTLMEKVPPQAQLIRKEAFGPIACIEPINCFEEGLQKANESDYGLQASVFTSNLQKAMDAVSKLDFGGVMINEAPNFRADHMPYGGNKRSGLGREGVRFAIEDMTQYKMVVLKPS